MARRRRPPRAGALSELPPLRIFSQIVALQSLYYFAALILFLFTALVAGTKFSLDLIFGWDAVRGDTTQGWLMGAAAIVVLIGRSKLVLDFALSMHAIHLVVVTIYSGQLPRNTAWWVAMAAASAVSVAIATWGCRHRELKPTFSFGGGGIAASSTAAGGNGDGGDGVGDGGMGGDEEQGFSRGRGRGRGRDGAGEYEMVAMNDTGR
ncbi:putative integral membrane protein [Thermochaetoides thermophila DSM 1495]|uniref:Putative integral membrane protein n=1 Tax=Chaetomium thermophilum (strain DSM 1495 / CBS 144.50 / IMI 039719) TaxID=759272 RepID=G0S2B9_CHATD|nr:putative integral membrane protein [Thermochaetoides thermophila DSM 1495]EGS22152.1 putative integral membrane protein [Thermochaetoides thermophila DSM 1495]